MDCDVVSIGQFSVGWSLNDLPVHHVQWKRAGLHIYCSKNVTDRFVYIFRNWRGNNFRAFREQVPSKVLQHILLVFFFLNQTTSTSVSKCKSPIQKVLLPSFLSSRLRVSETDCSLTEDTERSSPGTESIETHPGHWFSMPPRPPNGLHERCGIGAAWVLTPWKTYWHPLKLSAALSHNKSFWLHFVSAAFPPTLPSSHSLSDTQTHSCACLVGGETLKPESQLSHAIYTHNHNNASEHRRCFCHWARCHLHSDVPSNRERRGSAFKQPTCNWGHRKPLINEWWIGLASLRPGWVDGWWTIFAQCATQRGFISQIHLVKNPQKAGWDFLRSRAFRWWRWTLIFNQKPDRSEANTCRPAPKGLWCRSLLYF